MIERTPELIAAEVETHEVLTPWVAEHAANSGGVFSDLGYDPDKFPWQKIDVPYTPVKKIPSYIPDRVVLRYMRYKLSQHVGSKSEVNKMIQALQETPAFPDSDTSVSEAVNLEVERGSKLGLITDHLKKGNYRDIVIIMGLVVVAAENVDLRNHIDVLLGYPLTRQAVNGKSVVSETTNATGIIWTMQNTANRKSRPFPGLAVRNIAKGMSEALDERQSSDGTLTGVVTSGTGTEKIIDEYGNAIYERSEVSPSVNLMRWWDGVLPVAIYEGQVIPGPLHMVDKSLEANELELSRKQKAKRGEAMVYAALDSLSKNEANLTNTPVRYQSVDGEIKTVYPD